MKQPESSEDHYAANQDEQSMENYLGERGPGKKKRSFLVRLLWWLWGLALVLLALAGGIGAGILYSFYTELPSISRLEEFRPSLVTKVYDHSEELIGEFFIEKRALVTFNDLPEDFINALVAVEDKRFFEHFGVDPIGFARAMLINLKGWKFAQGASTLTQQLTRGLFLSPDKQVVRKIKEMMLAIQIEQKYTALEHGKENAKRKIMELYANQFYWGHGAYGVQAAAKLYFGKELDELDLGECAMLAGVLQLPARHSPLNHPDNAYKRRAHVLNRMIIEGYIMEGTFKIAEQTLTALHDAEVPEAVAAKLEPLKNHAYQTDEEFANALQSALGLEQSKQYQTLIMQSATEPSFKITDLTLQKLRTQLPEETLKKLAHFTLFGHTDKQEFLKLLETTLGTDLTEEHKAVILRFAAHDTAKKARVEPFKKKRLPEHQIDKSPYFVEYVRQYLEERYGDAVYRDGLQVYTTLDLHLQDVAVEAVQKGLRNIQRRHGFRLVDRDKTPEERAERIQVFEEREWKTPPEKGNLLHAVVTEVASGVIKVKMKDYVGTIDQKGLSEWFGKDDRKDPAKLVKVGDIIMVKVLDADHENHALKLKLDMEPVLEGALLSIDPKTGYIIAMVGGYDFYRSKFNRSVQALRQPGSAFKPFVYLTALERGLTPADIIVDEPVCFLIDERTGQEWCPRNFVETYKGPMTLRRALETSTNVISAKLMDRIGPHAVIDTARRLGISTYLNPYPSLALGSSEVLLSELVSAYCTFANRGYRVEPIFVTKVLDHDGNILEENVPRARQVLAEDVTYILVSMMQGVVQRGTAAEAKKLGRPLAGKTGTTNDNTNAFFVGFSPSLVTGVWVGYDESRKPIGKKETGGKAALPIWIDFMQEALKDTPIEEFPVPPGVNFVQIDPETGLLASSQCGESFTEVFKKGTEPKEFCTQSPHLSSIPEEPRPDEEVNGGF